jgi:hypothetical protein
MKKYARVALGVLLLTVAGIARGQGTRPDAPGPSDSPVPEKVPLPAKKPAAFAFQIVGPRGSLPLATYDNAGNPIPWVPGKFGPGAFGAGGNPFGGGDFGGGLDSRTSPGPTLRMLLESVDSKKKK